MLLLKGKPVAEHIYSRLKNQLSASSVTRPHLAVILVGEDPASQVYVSHKQKACENLGYQSSMFRLQAETSETELRDLVLKLNADASVHGILLQLPLPPHLDSKKLTNFISPLKDAD